MAALVEAEAAVEAADAAEADEEEEEDSDSEAISRSNLNFQNPSSTDAPFLTGIKDEREASRSTFIKSLSCFAGGEMFRHRGNPPPPCFLFFEKS